MRVFCVGQTLGEAMKNPLHRKVRDAVETLPCFADGAQVFICEVRGMVEQRTGAPAVVDPEDIELLT